MFLNWWLLTALLVFPASAQASGGAISLLEFWKNMGNAPISVSRDGQLIATTRSPAQKPSYSPYDTRLEVRDTQSMKLLYRARAANGDGKTLLFSPDSQTLWSAHTGTLRYEARTGKPGPNGEGSDGAGISAMTFTPDGRFYALSGVNPMSQGTFFVFDTEANKSLWLGPHSPPTKAEFAQPNWTYSLAFSPDSKMLASGSGGGGILLWDAKTGQRLGHLNDPTGISAAMRAGWTAHASAVTALYFVTPARLVSASTDGEIKLWDVKTGQVLSRLKLSSKLNALRLAPDGQLLAATERGLMLVSAKNNELKLEETLFNALDPFTDVSITAQNHLWTITRGGTLAHWLLNPPH